MTKHAGAPSGRASPPGSFWRPKRVRVWRWATASGAALTLLLIATVLVLAHNAGDCTPGDMVPDCEHDNVVAGFYLASGLGVLTAGVTAALVVIGATYISVRWARVRFGSGR